MSVVGAIVLTDPLLDEEEYQEILKFGLITYRISKYSELSSLSKTKKMKDGYYLFFENPRIRFDVEKIIQFLNRTNDLTIVKSKDRRVIAFDINKITVDNGTIHGSYPFNTNQEITEKPPKSPVPDIYMVAHSREDYLKFTLNSLLYSFKNLVKKPTLKIFMNTPTQELFNTVVKYQQENENIEWYKSDVNLRWKSIRTLMDYFEPEIFTYAEEDFILPPEVTTEYPYWPQQFYSIAARNGFVGWRSNNMPKDPFWKATSGFKTIPTYDHRWDINYTTHRILAGHLISIKSSLYRSIDDTMQKHNCSATDEWLSNSCTFEASPTTFGYHIGYNNVMDNLSAAHYQEPKKGRLEVIDHTGKRHVVNIL